MATPPFNPNVPLATSSPSQDQPVLLANSQTWFQTWNADGVTAGSSTNAGFSNQRTFVRRTSAPDANELNGQVFSMEDTAGVAQLYWMAANQDGAGISQLTSNAPGETPSGSSGYYSYTTNVNAMNFTIEQTYWSIPGGLQIKNIRVSQKSYAISSTNTTVPFLITYAGTGGVAVPFASQTVYASIYTYSNQNIKNPTSESGIATLSGNTQGLISGTTAYNNALTLILTVSKALPSSLTIANILIMGV